MNNRRKLVIAFGAGTLASPLYPFAQQKSGKVAHIGFLGLGSPTNSSSWIVALRAGFRDLGYFEGKNIDIDFRWAEGSYDRLLDLASELVRLKVDALVTHGTPGVRAAMRATSTIPVVMAAGSDALATGLVTSLARPGGNMTGLTFFAPETSAKRLEMLKQAIPRITHVAVLLNPDNPLNEVFQALEVAAKLLKLTLRKFEARSPNNFDVVFAAIAKSRVDAILVHQDPILNLNAKSIAAHALKHRLPTIGFDKFAEAGGLMAYAADLAEMFRRAAHLVDKILKGTKPGDIPIEQAMKFEIVINMKTAKALGIKFPPTTLVSATKTIE